VSSKSLQSNPADADPEIDPIRVELLSTEMPIHQIAKGGDEEIRIMRRKSGGQVELQWRIDYNPAVGRPGQLAYRLDTWVIKRRLSELPWPLSRLVRIGDLRQIARELKHGADTAAVRRAFDQNAATFIRAKVRYRTKSGEDETLEGYFNRYNVFYRGHALPGGRRAETVYISLNDPYYGLLKDSYVRPLDFAYLRQLTPAAQRFYELISPKMFAALKNGRSTAWIRYTDYCQYAVQKPQPNRSRMQTQMAAVHRIHRESGYIANVTYRTSPHEDGTLDWTIEYEPGPRARAEYGTFNNRMPRAEKCSSRRQAEPRRSASTRRIEPTARSTSLQSRVDPAESLARRFAQHRHGAEPGTSITEPEIRAALRVLHAASGDLALAENAVDLAVEESKTSRTEFPTHLGGVLQGHYVDRARKAREVKRAREEREIQQELERKHHQQYEDWCRYRTAGRIEDLSPTAKRKIIRSRLSAFTEANHFLIERRSWSASERRSWVEKRILVEYGREGQPTYEEWSRQNPLPPPTLTPTC
jgi:hypothetical protein